MRKLNPKQEQELKALYHKHTLLNPQAVVSFAEDPRTALHSAFTWDDTEAAREYRLWQARQVLRVAVWTCPDSSEPVRMYVSLQNDRGKEGGYRAVEDVLKDSDLRKQMLAEALAELEVFQRKFRLLSELKPVFAAVSRVKKQHEQKREKTRKPKATAKSSRHKVVASRV